MPLPFTKTIAIVCFAAFLCAGAGQVMAADWDDGDWGHRHCRQDGWRRSGWVDDDAAASAQRGYGGCYVVDRPIRDEWGNVVDDRSVEVCE